MQDYNNIIAVVEHSPYQQTKTIPSQLGVVCISVWTALNSIHHSLFERLNVQSNV